MSFWEEAETRAKAKSTPNDDDFDVNLDDLSEDKVDDDEDVESGTEEEEEEEVDVEDKDADTDVEPPTKSKVDETGLTPEQQAAAKEQVLKQVGPDTILKVKGVEKKASELSPKELVIFLQKGMNADRLYQEAAIEKRELARQKAMVEQGVASIQEYTRQHKTGPGGLPANAKDLGLITEIPDYLKPSAEDTSEVSRWKEDQVRILDEFNQMKSYIISKEKNAGDQAKVDEVIGLRGDYPMASIDEVLAVKTVRPDIESEELMRASHNYYSGGEFIKKALDANPTFKREYDAAVIKGYLAGKQKAPKIKGRKAHGSNIDKVSFGKSYKNTDRTFEKAGELSHQFFDELDKLEG